MSKRNAVLFLIFCLVILNGGVLVAYWMGLGDGRALAEAMMDPPPAPPPEVAPEVELPPEVGLLAIEPDEPLPQIDIGDFGGGDVILHDDWLAGAADTIITAGGGSPELILKGDGTLWWDGHQVTCDEELVHALRSMFETWMTSRGWSAALGNAAR